MKITLAKSNGGALWLVLFIFIPAALLAAYLMWKVCHWHPTYDPTHGNGDPETNATMVADIRQQYGSNSTIVVPALNNVRLPIDALAFEWYETTLTSTNLRDWSPAGIQWAEALDAVQTNHNEPARFYQRVLWY